jgi:hypothetical protein
MDRNSTLQGNIPSSQGYISTLQDSFNGHKLLDLINKDYDVVGNSSGYIFYIDQ